MTVTQRYQVYGHGGHRSGAGRREHAAGGGVRAAAAADRVSSIDAGPQIVQDRELLAGGLIQFVS